MVCGLCGLWLAGVWQYGVCMVCVYGVWCVALNIECGLLGGTEECSTRFDCKKRNERTGMR